MKKLWLIQRMDRHLIIQSGVCVGFVICAKSPQTVREFAARKSKEATKQQSILHWLDPKRSKVVLLGTAKDNLKIGVVIYEDA